MIDESMPSSSGGAVAFADFVVPTSRVADYQRFAAPANPTPFSGGGFSNSAAPAFYLGGQQKSTPSPPTPDTPPMSHHGSSHALHRNSSSGDLNIHKLQRVKSVDNCRVCGDSPARFHYGVPTCFGCKGFFRRTLKRTKEYTCRYNGNCVVDRYERNSCRYCRFKRCLDVGMDPKAVRPDRDAAGRSHPIRHRRSRVSLGDLNQFDDDDPTDEWVRKLPVDMRTLLMQVMNIDLMVSNGDTHADPMQLYPLQFGSLREILDDPTMLDGKRTEMRYEPYRKARSEEMVAVAHRRLIAVIDMVDHLCVLMDVHNTHDKLALVKAAYAPLALFCTVAATARTTKDRDIFCLCCCGYISRDSGNGSKFDEPYHFTNRIVQRALDELVEPFRAFNFKEQEVALMKAIVALNPHIRALSNEAAEQVADMRDRIQETLYNVVRESHPKEVASSRFGNLLLFLPNIMLLGNTMYENLQFLQSFSQRHVDPLLAELLDNLDPVQDPGVNAEDILALSDSEGRMLRNSQSNSSLSSMGSHESYPNGMTGIQQQQHQPAQQNTSPPANGDYFNRRQSADPCFPMQNGSQTAPQLQQQDSDPDYNVTLTAENFSGMRHAIATMEIDQDPSVADFYPPATSGADKPRFYIDSYAPPTQTTSTVQTTVGSRHVFTIEATKDPNYFPQTSNGYTNGQPLPEMNPPNGIAKSQSYPYFLQYQQQGGGFAPPSSQQNGQMVRQMNGYN